MVALITGLLGIGPGRTRLVGTVLALITTAAGALNSNGGIQVATPLLKGPLHSSLWLRQRQRHGRLPDRRSHQLADGFQ
jgi:hypothetical protein